MCSLSLQDYEIDYDPLYFQTDLSWDPNDPEGDSGGIWVGPKELGDPKEALNENSSQSIYPPTCNEQASLSNQFGQNAISTMGTNTSAISQNKPAPALSPLHLSSVSTSGTSSVSPTTPPSSSTSQGISPSSPTPSPSSIPPPQILLSAEEGLTTCSNDNGLSVIFTEKGQRQNQLSIKDNMLLQDIRNKPHLTITVPSNEDLRNLKVCISSTRVGILLNMIR